MPEPYYHSLRFDTTRCNGCMSCMRACPTQAIRVRSGRAVMLEDRCIDCGECLKVCTRDAVVPLTGLLAELSRFEYTVAIPSPALYTQFDGGVKPAAVHEALRRCGFDAVAGLSQSCALVTAAIEFYLAEFRGGFPVISSFCPTVVRLIQVKYPALLDQLLPILSPREVTAREVKRATAERFGLDLRRIGTVYVTPCPSKMVSIVDHPGQDSSHINSVVSIGDLFPHLVAAVQDAQAAVPAAEAGETESASSLGWALSRGLAASLPAEDTMSVAGLPNVVRILDDIEQGRLRHYTFVECHACSEGCVSGVLTVANPYVARVRAIRLMQSLGEGPPLDGGAVRRRYHAGEFHMGLRIGARPMRPLHDTISGAIARMKEREGLAATLPGIDCGACGAPSCTAFADDVVRGEADEDWCVFVRQRQIEAAVTELAALCRQQSQAPGRAGPTTPA